VNAAFLMLTTAWLAGADAAPTPPAPPAPVVSAPIGGGCGGGCGCATDACCEKPKLLDRIKAKFHKNDCGCGCEAPTCCAPKPVCCPAPKPVCCPAPKPVCCAPAPTCCHAAPTCGCGCEEPRVKLLDKIKAKFHKNECCESSCGCGGCGCGGAISTGAPAEAIPTKPAPGGAPMPKPPSGAAMNTTGMIVTPVVAPRLSTEQPF
jgi:hypothetical protein